MPYTHALDIMAVLQMISTPIPPKQIRHYLREKNHYSLLHVRTKLENLHYYTEPTEAHPTKSLKIAWIKGHSGNRLHECADRQAARIASRIITTSRGPNPNQLIHNYTTHRSASYYPLYFYECLVSNDIRKHARSVCKEIHKTAWSQKKPSQGRILRIMNSQTGGKRSYQSLR
eukprot:7491659-Pyramimonas_sp.AAC.1